MNNIERIASEFKYKPGPLCNITEDFSLARLSDGKIVSVPPGVNRDAIYPTPSKKKDGKTAHGLIPALRKVFELSNDHTEHFFFRLYHTLQYLRENLSPGDFSLLGSILADYTKWNQDFWAIYNVNTGKQPFCPPKRRITIGGFQRRIQGIDVILERRLMDLGADSHLRTISKCSTAGLWLYEEDQGLNASINLPCRKPSCPYCSHLIKEGEYDVRDRSQAIWERGVNHWRYCLVGGKVLYYGRMIFTLPKEIQGRVDKNDLKDFRRYGSVKVYGSKIEREISEMEEERERELELAKDKDEHERILGKFRARIWRKRKLLRDLEQFKDELEQVKQEITRISKEKPKGYTRELKILRSRKKKLKVDISRRVKMINGDRITLSELQSKCADFLYETFGIRGSLITPHLTGDESKNEGLIHIHLHVLFPLFGDESVFNWDQGQPYLDKEWLGDRDSKEAGLLAHSWKGFLKTQFGLEDERGVANPQYQYIRAAENPDSLQYLAFCIRYDHRIEAGGPWFLIMANDKDACRVLRMTTRQRYTRGYGILSDRNLKAFREENGGKFLKEALIAKGVDEIDGSDKRETLEWYDGEWKVLTAERLAQDVPFETIIEGRGRSKIAKDELCLPIKANIDDPVFVFYANRLPEGERMKVSESEMRVLHSNFNVWSQWKRVWENTYRLVRVFGKVPEDKDSEKRTGFYGWSS